MSQRNIYTAGFLPLASRTDRKNSYQFPVLQVTLGLQTLRRADSFKHENREDDPGITGINLGSYGLGKFYPTAGQEAGYLVRLSVSQQIRVVMD